MPREDRRVFFDLDESYKAVYTLCGQKAIPKPVSGVLRKVDINLDDPLNLDFQIESNRSGQMETSTFTKDFVIAALMVMCRNIGIPLPKGANKTLEMIRGQLVLRVQMLR